MVELRRKGVAIPSNVINDLRSAKLMITISEAEGSRGEALLNHKKLGALKPLISGLGAWKKPTLKHAKKKWKKTNLSWAFLGIKNGLGLNPSEICQPSEYTGLPKKATFQLTRKRTVD